MNENLKNIESHITFLIDWKPRLGEINGGPRFSPYNLKVVGMAIGNLQQGFFMAQSQLIFLLRDAFNEW